MITGTVFDIQRMSVHDGPGIRTTVFLKGCPLRCLWCHNPESNRVKPELAFYENLCIGCGDCMEACPNGCHSLSEKGHGIDRSHCAACGVCESACTGALKVIGKIYTVEEVMYEVRKDVRYYRTSGGGMTVSGGEPLMQPEFACALLAAAKAEGLHTCIETAGYVSWEALEKAAPLVDLFLYDIKETDPERHKQYTGVRNERIRENLIRLDEMGCSVIMRCPMIPGLNDREDHLQGIAALANRLKHVQMIHIEPYNSFGESKSKSIGAEYALKGLEMPEDEQVERWVHTVQKYTGVPVIRS